MVLAAREMKRDPKNVLLEQFLAWSLTLAPHSLLLNRTETLATQAKRSWSRQSVIHRHTCIA